MIPLGASILMLVELLRRDIPRAMHDPLRFSGLRGLLRYAEPMARHTSWRVGGPADYYFTPADRADLANFLSQLPDTMDVVWVGLGSNLLVRDGGIRGAVITTHKGLVDLRRDGDTGVVAEAGVPCAKVARFSARAGLGGAEFLAGIPGSMGGALAMNAGAFGGATWDVLTAVETVDRQGRFRTCAADRIESGYRSVRLPNQQWFVSAVLALTADAEGQGPARIRELLRRRGASQPVQSANAGSVFRNPPGDHAARLIDSAGLKGLTEGGAVVSEKHANFIINPGTATAADIEGLIGRVKDRVRAVHDIELQPEVCIVGEVR